MSSHASAKDRANKICADEDFIYKQTSQDEQWGTPGVGQKMSEATVDLPPTMPEARVEHASISLQVKESTGTGYNKSYRSEATYSFHQDRPEATGKTTIHNKFPGLVPPPPKEDENPNDVRTGYVSGVGLIYNGCIELHAASVQLDQLEAEDSFIALLVFSSWQVKDTEKFLGLFKSEYEQLSRSASGFDTFLPVMMDFFQCAATAIPLVSIPNVPVELKIQHPDVKQLVWVQRRKWYTDPVTGHTYSQWEFDCDSLPLTSEGCTFSASDIQTIVRHEGLYVGPALKARLMAPLVVQYNEHLKIQKELRQFKKGSRQRMELDAEGHISWLWIAARAENAGRFDFGACYDGSCGSPGSVFDCLQIKANTNDDITDPLSAEETLNAIPYNRGLMPTRRQIHHFVFANYLQLGELPLGGVGLNGQAKNYIEFVAALSGELWTITGGWRANQLFFNGRGTVRKMWA